MPSPGSARAANAVTPGSAAVSAHPLATAEATSHGRAAAVAAARPNPAQNSRERPVPGASVDVNATAAASISPVGVSPATAIQNTSAQIPPKRHSARGSPGFSRVEYSFGEGPARNDSTVAATQGRQP